DKEPSSQQVAMILNPTHVITFQEWNTDFFKQIKERLKNNKGLIRKMGPEYLAYALLDYAVDTYFTVLETMEIKLDALEDTLLEYPKREVLTELQAFKKILMFLRKATWPMREIISKLETREFKLMPKTLRIYLRDLYEHMIQVIDIIENQRELLSGMMDIYLSSTSNRMNLVMKTLTIISTIFIPLTFVTGLYGMNFDFMPELSSPVGYPIVLAVMATVSIVLLLTFKKRGWL
nr:magnesium/cobalt transporter CorA [Candidatus Sigynarchaeota archaeon]